MKRKDKWQRDLALGAPLGVFSLGFVTLLWGFSRTGWTALANEEPLIISSALFFGVATTIAGLALFFHGDTFGFSLLSLFGLLWIALGSARLISATGLFGVAAGDLNAQGLAVFFLLWTLVSATFLLQAFRVDRFLGVSLVAATFLSVLLTISWFFEAQSWKGAGTLLTVVAYFGILAGSLTMGCGINLFFH